MRLSLCHTFRPRPGFTGIASWRTMLSVFVGGYVMGLLFNLWGANEFMLLPAHFHLLLGGFDVGPHLIPIGFSIPLQNST